MQPTVLIVDCKNRKIRLGPTFLGWSETVICFVVYVRALFQQYRLCGVEWYGDIIPFDNCLFSLPFGSLVLT